MSYVMQAARGPDFRAGGDDPRGSAAELLRSLRKPMQPLGDHDIRSLSDQGVHVPNLQTTAECALAQFRREASEQLIQEG